MILRRTLLCRSLFPLAGGLLLATGAFGPAAAQNPLEFLFGRPVTASAPARPAKAQTKAPAQAPAKPQAKALAKAPAKAPAKPSAKAAAKTTVPTPAKTATKAADTTPAKAPDPAPPRAADRAPAQAAADKTPAVTPARAATGTPAPEAMPATTTVATPAKRPVTPAGATPAAAVTGAVAAGAAAAAMPAVLTSTEAAAAPTVLASSGTAAKPLGEKDIVERANAYFNAISSLISDFVQIGGEGRRLTGKLFLQRPGKIRFEYDPPATLEVIADGSSVAVRDKKLATQDLYSIGQTPLKFLLRERIELGRDLTITDVAAENEGARISVEDRSTLGGTSKITLYFDKDVANLTRWRIVDPQGFQTTVSLANVERNKRIEQQLFTINYDRILGDR